MTEITKKTAIGKLGDIFVVSDDTISLDSTKFASIPTGWADEKILKTTVTEGTFEFVDAPIDYTLPIASGGTLGGIKVGTRLSIDGSGVLSADAQGGSYTAGYGIDIVADEISVDTLVVASHDWVTEQGYLTTLAHNDTTSIQGGIVNEYYHLDADTYNNVATIDDIPTLVSELTNDAGYISTIAHNNTTGLQGGAVGEYYHLDGATYNTVATTGDIPTYTAGYGINLVANEISVDTLEVATMGIIIPGVLTDEAIVYIQTDNPTPRRGEVGEIEISTSPTGAAITLYKTSLIYSEVTDSQIHVVNNVTGNAIQIDDSHVYLETGGDSYDFYNEYNLDIDWFASIPLPWESGKYLKATAVEGTLEWATAGTGGGIADVPDDGNLYVREYENWVQLGTLVFSTNDDNVTLPASPSVGDAYEMVGTGTAWTVTANTGQYIRLVTTESAAQGVASGATGFECASFIYIGATGGHNTWLIRSAAGTIGVT
jgi:hypothetical protein